MQQLANGYHRIEADAVLVGLVWLRAQLMGPSKAPLRIPSYHAKKALTAIVKV
jgi:hypothetical protein